MPLHEYRAKRALEKTPEPAGSVRPGAGRTPAGAELIANLEGLGAPRRSVQPHEVSVMLAESRAQPFSREGWIFELKYDGYRLIAGRNDDQVVLLSRNKNPLTATFPEIAAALEALPYTRIVMDGEVVICDASGRPNFQKLQKRGMLRRGIDIRRAAVELPATLYVFDLLAFDEFDLRGLPLSERKRLLKQLIPAAGVLQYADHIHDRGEDFFHAAEALQVEGMVGKKADSRYRAGRSADWIKVRSSKQDDFVVVGFTAPGGSRAGFGALHLAVYAEDRLVYAGSVGTGFTAKLIDSIHETVRPLKVRKAPCSGAPTGRDHTWIEPQHVCEVKYLEWTEEGLLRHPVFIRMRSDKTPQECTGVIRADGAPVEEAPPAPVLKKSVFSNLDKIFWPDDGYTKQDLIDYYKAVSPWLLPYLDDRPVVLTRFPNGIDGKSFFQKDAACVDLDGLLSVINLGAIPLHLWSSRKASLEHPDWCIIDLDPKQAPFSDVVNLALVTKQLCDDIGLPAFVKTSGSSGLHVLIPLGRQCTHEQSKLFAELLARAIVQQAPDIATVIRTPSKRAGKVYVDFMQNGHGKLLVAPYAVRPLPGAPVSAPLEWAEVDAQLDLRAFTIRTMPKRLERMRKDPLRAVLSLSPDLVTALTRLQRRY